MNPNTPSNNASSNVPWPTSDIHMPVPDTSLLPGSGSAPPAAVHLLSQAVQGAHQTLDRLASSATPVAQKLSNSVNMAEATVHARTDQLRASVRNHPLLSCSVALVIGAALVRVARAGR